jgi:hydrophobic/amphiphilic exporter-1 (mainly G- bacteria), HAE1 family
MTDVFNAIRYRNIDMTTGYVDSSSYRFRVRGKSQFVDLEEMGEIILGNGTTQIDQQMMTFAKLAPAKDNLAGQGALTPIRLKDVAEIVDTFKEKRGLVRIIDEKRGPSEGIGMAVIKETDGNMVEVADHVKESLKDINSTLPAGVEVNVSFDLSEIITDSISALKGSAAEGAFMAAIVIFVFLFRVRPTLIIITSIPLSLLAAAVAMYFSGYTLNIMTLGGMVIAVGKLVDDSIVVLENIYRHISMGEDPYKAAEEGTREVATAVVSATLVAVIIFLPVAFSQGLSAQLFKTFAGTIFFALMGSMVIAFTVIPMLSSRLLKKEKKDTDRHGGGRFFGPISRSYGDLLAWAINNTGKVVMLALLVLILTGVMGAHMVVTGKYEFVPRLVGGLYRAQVELPPGALMEETDKVMTRVTNILAEELDDYHHFFMVIGESGDPQQAAFTGGEQTTAKAEMNLKMYKHSQSRKLGRRITSDKKLRKIWDDFSEKNPNVQISFQQAGSLDFSNEKPIKIKVYGNDFGVLKKITDDIAEKVKKIEGTRDVTTSLQKGIPEYRYRFDRDRLASYGMLSGYALNEAKTAIDGQMASIYREGGKEYDITVQLKRDQVDSFEKVQNVKIMSPVFGFHVPLRDVAEFRHTSGPSKITRENSTRMVSVGANKTEDRELGKIASDIEAMLKDVNLPEGYSLEFGGEIEDLKDAMVDLALMFGAALILVYLILASLYESLIHPITIMIAIPLAFTGAIAGLYITNTPFGVTAFIGFIMLVGIVATNSIVLMDFILEFHREKGLERGEAIIQAGKTRLRPILMTALTTMFGVLPIAWGRAEGMELQQPMGIVVVGGLVSSTILTLVIIPVFYQIFDVFSEDMKNLFKRKKKQDPPPVPVSSWFKK